MITRIITALALIICFLILNYFASETVFIVVISIITVLAGAEWFNLGSKNKSNHLYFYLLILIVLLIAAWFFNYQLSLTLIAFGALWWIYRFVLLFTGRIAKNSINILASGLWVLLIAWMSITLVHKNDATLLLIGFIWVWGADSFAYFVGKFFGKTKLAVNISPGKTIEGVVGGVIGVVVLAIISAIVIDVEKSKWIIWIVCAIFLSIISVGGDLYESWLKRQRGIKDSGTLLPGHGGVLDRIDGLLAFIPFYYLLTEWLIT